MSTSSSAAPERSQSTWAAYMPYFTSPAAGVGAIVLPFKFFMDKTALQKREHKGELISRVSWREGIKEGVKTGPTIGAIIGAQMVAQNILEQALTKDSKPESLSSKFLSSALVGALSAPLLAIFNGRTMKWGPLESLRKFSPKQGLAIAFQETAFVSGLSVADHLGKEMKEKFGDNKAVEYGAAALAGGLGSAAGHPGNTALTRWQRGMPLSFRHIWWGGFARARGGALFSLLYKLGKDTLNSSVKTND